MSNRVRKSVSEEPTWMGDLAKTWAAVSRLGPPAQVPPRAPSPTAVLLQRLGEPALVHLCRLHGMGGLRTLEERRVVVAQHYGDDVRGCLLDLRRDHLAQLLTRARLRNVRGKAAGTSRLPLGILRDLAFQLVMKESAPTPAPAPEAPPTTSPPPEDRLLEGLTGAWSRPRALPPLLRQVGLECPSRLTLGRFQELLRRLELRGVEMLLPDGTVAHMGCRSPGLEARVRLRARARSTPPPEVRLVPGGRGGSDRPVESDESQAYELALLKLRFLTAVPSVDRLHQPEWPAGFVARATDGLKLGPVHLRLITTVASTYGMGGHDPMALIPLLLPRLSPTEWERLLGDYQQLNAHSPQFVSDVVTVVRSRLEPARAAAPVLTAPPATAAPPPPEAPRAEPELNSRPLGALVGIFD
ncbi:MAG: hypothetical protein AB2A00_19245 [Myxococcota bacterium]